MTTHDEGGYHESLIAEQMDLLEPNERQRLLAEYGEVLAELRRCPGAMSGAPDSAGEEEPAVRWSPWARGRLRSCGDHAGHIEHRFRMAAQHALNAEDVLWKAWNALAESRRLWEASQILEASLSGPDGVEE